MIFSIVLKTFWNALQTTPTMTWFWFCLTTYVGIFFMQAQRMHVRTVIMALLLLMGSIINTTIPGNDETLITTYLLALLIAGIVSGSCYLIQDRVVSFEFLHSMEVPGGLGVYFFGIILFANHWIFSSLLTAHAATQYMYINMILNGIGKGYFLGRIISYLYLYASSKKNS